MSLTYVNKKAIKKASKTGALILAAGITLFSFGGCAAREIATNANVHYDVIDTMDENLVTSGVQQIIDVPGEDFQLVVNYRCVLEDNAKWTITSDKEMYMEVRTEGLDPNTSVFIDNVHIDTTIRSVYPSVDGITQDTMDDRIHNAQMIGFPISDDNPYSNVNCIEGQNQTFIQGSMYGFNGYTSGSFSEKRFVESDYLNAGVDANQFTSVIDLIIVKPDGTTTCKSVKSTIGVSVWPYIERVNKNGESTFRYYYFDKDSGKVKYIEYTAAEYAQLTQTGKQYHK